MNDTSAKISFVHPIGISFFRFSKCISIHFDPTILRKSIRRIQLAWKNATVSNPLYISVHHPENTWPIMPINANNWQRIQTNEFDVFHLDFEILNFLDYNNEPCEASPDYKIDDCFEKYFNNKAMKEFGCTTKFGNDKTNVCPEGSNKEKEAETDLIKTMNFKSTQVCTYPCILMNAKLRSDNQQKSNATSLDLHVNNYVKVTTFRHSYTELELLAELGGYVGLFLGISVFHLSDLFDSILNRLTL